jgi:hypothetical protein
MASSRTGSPDYAPNPPVPNPTSPITPELMKQLEQFPEQRARILDAQRRKESP